MWLPYKSVARMYALAAFPLRNLYYPVAIEIGRRLAQVKRKRRAQRVLGAGIGVGVERCYSYSMLSCGFSDAANKLQRWSVSSSQTDRLLGERVGPPLQCYLAAVGNENRIKRMLLPRPSSV